MSNLGNLSKTALRLKDLQMRYEHPLPSILHVNLHIGGVCLVSLLFIAGIIYLGHKMGIV